MVPTTLEGWTLEALKRLLTAKVAENDSFDFKEQLPHAKDDASKAGLGADCAAFANAAGGFLVFGVADDKALAPDARLVGVDARDFTEQFGNYPKACSPSVPWDPRDGGIELLGGKRIEVVYIPKSWRAPHSVELPRNSGSFRFPKRTNKGTEYMSIGEVQQMFLGLQEKRRKLEMLRAELGFLGMVVEGIKPTNLDGLETSTVTPPVEVLQVLMGDTFVLLEQDAQLLNALNTIRRLSLSIREGHAAFLRRLSFPSKYEVVGANHVELQTRNHNASLREDCERMEAALSLAQERLRGLLDQR